MKKVDYEQLIRCLSSAYEKKGRVYHDEVLASLEGKISQNNYRILKQVVLFEYLEKMNANTRIFGAFPEWDIKSLSIKCSDLEYSFNNSHL